jgi:Trypsin-like peptidase domain
MNRVGSRLAGVLLGAVVSSEALGCAPRTDDAAGPDGDLQSICGPKSELRDVELYEGGAGVTTAFVNRHRLAVGLVRWKDDLFERYREESGNVAGRGWCSGTLIADDLFLTAGHCLDSADTAGFRLPREKGGVLLDAPEVARELEVQFRFETPAQTDAPSYGNTAEVVRLEEYSLAGPDYAILRLEGHPGVDHGVARLSPRETPPGEPIALLQHPRAQPMKIGAGPVAGLSVSRISYDTIDTLDGSSGAGILDGVTGKLVGVHTNGGCSADGSGENFGATIGALAAVSKTIRDFVDRSRDFLVGDWNNDGLSDLAVLVDGCLYPDADHDEKPDPGAQWCAIDRSADQYFVGKWRPGVGSQLGWRRGNCLYVEESPTRPVCFDPPFEALVADWNGDGQSDWGIRRGSCIDFDTNLDGALDDVGYCYGYGVAEDEYLVGHWDGGTRDSIAIRRANTVLSDVDHDGAADESPLVFGHGGNEAQYLVGDWSGSGRSELAVRRGTQCSIRVGAGLPDGHRGFIDFWSEP